MTPINLFNFQIEKPFAPDEAGKTYCPIIIDEAFYVESLTTANLLSQSNTVQKALRQSLSQLLSSIFIMEKDWRYIVDFYFSLPGPDFVRHALLIKTDTNVLIGTAIFDVTMTHYDRRPLKSIYIHVRAISQLYQASGLGKWIAQKVLMEFQPDLLFTTCAQSSSLHSWITLPEKGDVMGYDVFPRFVGELEQEGTVITLPYEALPFAVEMFNKTYLPHVNWRQEKVNAVIRDLTVWMVRKNVGLVYAHPPWRKNGKEDHVAKALGVMEPDAVLVMFIKKGVTWQENSFSAA